MRVKRFNYKMVRYEWICHGKSLLLKNSSSSKTLAFIQYQTISNKLKEWTHKLFRKVFTEDKSESRFSQRPEVSRSLNFWSSDRIQVLSIFVLASFLWPGNHVHLLHSLWLDYSINANLLCKTFSNGGKVYELWKCSSDLTGDSEHAVIIFWWTVNMNLMLQIFCPDFSRWLPSDMALS